MIRREASAEWRGKLQDGRGSMRTGSGGCEGPYSFSSRFENGKGTNPEELIGAAHAGCFSMALSGILAKAGFSPRSIKTRASVEMAKEGEGYRIASVTLDTEAEVAGLEEGLFVQHAQDAKDNCPVSQALAGVEIRLNARLL